ncbi:MAG: hypothetical protein J6W23_09830, partial [Victivallales bacterium]|nr:hypothetical protein [Victivallales bacterium]
MKNYMHCALAIMLGVTLFGVKAAAEPSEALRMAMLVEDAFSEVVDNSKDAVVTILNKQYRRAPQMMGDVPPELFMFPQFRGYRRQLPRNDDKRL